jgi:hypothetical protein
MRAESIAMPQLFSPFFPVISSSSHGTRPIQSPFMGSAPGPVSSLLSGVRRAVDHP